MDLGRESAAASVSAAAGCKVVGEPGKGVKTKGNKWRKEGMKVGNRKFCCIAKSKLAKLLHAVRQMKEGARRSKEKMTEKCGAKILDEEKQQGRKDSPAEVTGVVSTRAASTAATPATMGANRGDE